MGIGAHIRWHSCARDTIVIHHTVWTSRSKCIKWRNCDYRGIAYIRIWFYLFTVTIIIPCNKLIHFELRDMVCFYMSKTAAEFLTDYHILHNQMSGVIVYNGISYDIKNYLFSICGKLTTRWCVYDILSTIASPSFHSIPNLNRCSKRPSGTQQLFPLIYFVLVQ